MRESVRIELVRNEIEQARIEIVSRHRVCKGKGVIEVLKKDDHSSVISSKVRICSCLTKFELVSRFILSNIPYKNVINQQIYKKMVFDEITKETLNLRRDIIHPYIRHIRPAMKHPYGMLFLGKNGTGKTFVGWKVLYYAIINGFTAHYISLSDLLKIIIKNYDHDLDDLVAEISNVDILMIDEVGNESRRSDFTVSEFKMVYKKRIEIGKPTIMVSNFSYEEFKEAYGKSVDDVISSYAKILNFKDTVNVRQLKGSTEMNGFFKQIKRKSVKKKEKNGA